MTRPYTATERNDSQLYKPEWTDRYGQYFFANSSRWPSDKAVASDIHIGNAVWRVYLEPQDGWRPSWEHGAIAAVVLGSLILSLLVAIIMALWSKQHQLLGDVMVRGLVCDPLRCALFGCVQRTRCQALISTALLVLGWVCFGGVACKAAPLCCFSSSAQRQASVSLHYVVADHCVVAVQFQTLNGVAEAVYHIAAVLLKRVLVTWRWVWHCGLLSVCCRSAMTSLQTLQPSSRRRSCGLMRCWFASTTCSTSLARVLVAAEAIASRTAPAQRAPSALKRDSPWVGAASVWLGWCTAVLCCQLKAVPLSLAGWVDALSLLSTAGDRLPESCLEWLPRLWQPG